MKRRDFMKMMDTQHKFQLPVAAAPIAAKLGALATHPPDTLAQTPAVSVRQRRILSTCAAIR
jgi:hypothetical protein